MPRVPKITAPQATDTPTGPRLHEDAPPAPVKRTGKAKTNGEAAHALTGSVNPIQGNPSSDTVEAVEPLQTAANAPDTSQIGPEAPAARLEAASPVAEAVQQQFLAFLAAGCPKGLYFHVTLKTGPKFRTWPWNNKPLTPLGAWYFSTGGSNHKRLRQRENQKALCAIVLDDVGSKIDRSKITLEPTWKLITSPGNEQWGYALGWTDDIEGGDALMKALVAADMQDKGVNTCCRLFRLPGSINDKPDRDNFVSTLVEGSWHPERIFTIESIAAGLRLTITREPRQRKRTSIKVAPTNDRIFDWLADNGHILSRKNGKGVYFEVICPWADDEHSDDRIEAWVCPATMSDNGVFNAGCFHGHGDDPSAYRKRFLAWVREQGGPGEHDMSKFQAILAEICKAAGRQPDELPLEWRNEQRLTQDTHAKLAVMRGEAPEGRTKEGPQQRRERQRAENATIGEGETISYRYPTWNLNDFHLNVFALDTKIPAVAYIVDDRVQVRVMPTFTENFGHCKTAPPPGTKGKPRPTTALWRESSQRQFLAGATHSIGFPRFMQDGRLHGGQKIINTWQPKPLDEVFHPALKDFIAHLRFIFVDRTDELLQWLAHCEQKPWELPHQSWLSICETHGIGRNWIASVLTRVWAGEVAASLDLGALMTGNFNNRIAGKRMAIVDEINLSTGASRHAIMAKRRQMITAEVTRINGKFDIEYDEINVMRWLVFSNHGDAMPLEMEDRREEVVFGPTKVKEPAYYTYLYGLLKDTQFIAALRWFLAHLDISTYNAGKRATLDAHKLRAIKASRSVMTTNAAEWIEDHPERTFATMAQMAYGEAGNDPAGAAQQWKHVVRELKLREVVCNGVRKHSIGNGMRKVYMVRPPNGWNVILGEPGTVTLDSTEYERMLAEVRQGDHRRAA